MDGYYYWTYRNHPLSSFNFLYDGILYAQSEYIAHSQAKDMIRGVDEFEKDIGVLVVSPINEYIIDRFSVDSINEVDDTRILDNQNLLRDVRSTITDEDIKEVGDRQQNMDEDGTGTTTIELEDEDYYF